MWNTLKYRWNDTEEEILTVFAQFTLTLKWIFSSFYGKLFLVLFQATIYIFKKTQKTIIT